MKIKSIPPPIVAATRIDGGNDDGWQVLDVSIDASGDVIMQQGLEIIVIPKDKARELGDWLAANVK